MHLSLRPLRLVLALLTGCWFVASGARLLAVELPPRVEITELSAAYTRYLEVTDAARALRAAEDLDGLEILSQELRQSKEALKSGNWLLAYFYDSVVQVSRKDPVEAEKQMAFYRHWAAERPQSLTAQICLADALTDYAWAARGSGWSNTVTEEGWRPMKERLALAWETLEKARALPGKCPHWTVVAQTVALGQSWDERRYFIMVEEGLRAEPTYASIYKSACNWMLPRWHGEEGDFEKWIAARADGHPAGDRHYALLVWQVDLLGWPDEMVFAPGRLDWERAKRGFDAWIEEEPTSLPLRFEALRLALLAEDRAAARAQFEVTGGKYWPAFWNKDPEQFEQARQYAYADGPNPLRPVETAESAMDAEAAGRLPNEKLQSWIKTGGRVCGGLLAGALCLVFAMQRRRPWLGVLVLPVLVLVATLYGTLAAALPVAVFLLYLLSKEPADLPETPPRPWGMTLLWVCLILVANLGMQIGATILALVPGIVANPQASAAMAAATRELFITGEALTYLINASWLSLVLIMVFCGRQPVAGWRNRLGLHAAPLGKSLLYVLGGGVLMTGSGLLAAKWDDGRTQAALELIAQGIHSPVIFFLAVVVIAPAFEECLLRGYAFHGWRGRLGFVTTMMLSAAIFAAIHLQYGWVGLLHIFVLGCVLAGIRGMTGSIYPALALHVLNNLAFFMSIYAGANAGK